MGKEILPGGEIQGERKGKDSEEGLDREFLRGEEETQLETILAYKGKCYLHAFFSAYVKDFY